jgi:hypothetical protein
LQRAAFRCQPPEINMPHRNWNDLPSIDYRALPLLEREEFRRQAIRQAHAARAEMMATTVAAVPRLVGRVFTRLIARRRARPAAIPGRTIAEI